jgi:glycosyltransferase involved in cell wall biosynthesis
MPRVSVQIPVRNCTHLLAEALESVEGQTYRDFEIVVVDDGSDEDVAAVTAKYPRAKLLRQMRDGVAAARNRALASSSGEWIAFLDADDLWRSDKLEKQMAYLQAHPHCDIVFAQVENFADAELLSLTPRQRQLLETKIDRCMVSSLMRAALFARWGNFAAQYVRGEDTEMLARLGAAGADLTHCVQEPLYLRRVHACNMSLKRERVARDAYLTLMADALRRAKSRRGSGAGNA